MTLLLLIAVTQFIWKTFQDAHGKYVTYYIDGILLLVAVIFCDLVARVPGYRS
jgi:hypothetical protein